MNIRIKQIIIKNDNATIITINGILSRYLPQKDTIKPRKLTPCIKSLNKLYILFISNKPNNSTNYNNTASNRNDYSKNIQIFKHTTYDKSILSNCQEMKSALFIYNTSNNSTNHNHSASNSNNKCHNIQILKHITYDESILSNCQEMMNKLHNVVCEC